jgi:hypothetical protein
MNDTTSENMGDTTIESVDDLFGNIESIPLDPNETNILDDSIVFNTSSIGQGSLHLSDLNTSQTNQSQGSLHLSDLNTSQPNQSQGSLHLSDLDVSEDSTRNNTTMESVGGKKRRKHKTKSKRKQTKLRKTKRKYSRKIKRIKFKQSGKKRVRKFKTRKIR